jgi:hypothetical protein
MLRIIEKAIDIMKPILWGIIAWTVIKTILMLWTIKQINELMK